MLSLDDPRAAPYLAEFARQSGVSVAEVRRMRPEQAHALILAWARARTLSRIELALLDEMDSAPPRYERRSAIVAVVLMTLTALAVIAVCSGAWRWLA